MKFRASFVIPAFNAERWVSKAIYSCRNQTIKQVEILVVNDGSTDDTKEIVSWHVKNDKEGRVVLIDLEKNVGRSEARNIGNSKVRSDLIVVLDADDMATRNRVKDTIASMQLKQCDLLYGSFWVIDGLGNILSKVPAMPFDPERSKQTKLNYICHSTMAYTKKLADHVKYEGDEFSKLGLDDWKFQWEAHKKGFILKHLKTPLCYYRDLSDNTTMSRDEKAVEKVKVAYLG